MNQFRLNEINLFDVIEWFEIQKSKSIETHLSFHFLFIHSTLPWFWLTSSLIWIFENFENFGVSLEALD